MCVCVCYVQERRQPIGLGGEGGRGVEEQEEEEGRCFVFHGKGSRRRALRFKGFESDGGGGRWVRDAGRGRAAVGVRASDVMRVYETGEKL
ncbi:hypothetical protein GWI33_007301 [Rhynchophorus ferrugineus]|uniref:Uncharacterized protein n=1 Tax=Rhynchophorus ferrugineus TaxID=354439 RepID=A0A834IKJ7_RHYFE|nr:hypothetical protein GWI33_007301 [Rhynchophorus ferrugineus]